MKVPARRVRPGERLQPLERQDAIERCYPWLEDLDPAGRIVETALSRTRHPIRSGRVDAADQDEAGVRGRRRRDRLLSVSHLVKAHHASMSRLQCHALDLGIHGVACRERELREGLARDAGHDAHARISIAK